MEGSGESSASSFYDGYSRKSDGWKSPSVLWSSTQSFISTSLTLVRSSVSLNVHMFTLCLNKQCDWCPGISDNTGGKREPTIPVSAWTLTRHPLPYPPRHVSRANASLPPRWALITVCSVLWDPQMKAVIKAKSVITFLRIVIGPHLALETDQAGMLNHETEVGQILHLL